MDSPLSRDFRSGLFVTILFLQRDPTTSFTIFETLSSIVPEGSANQPITFFAKSEVYKWLGCALNLSAPPDGLRRKFACNR